MAQVTVDISEYDALRDNYSEAKERIKQLESNLKKADDKGRVIIKTVINTLTANGDSFAREVERVLSTADITHIRRHPSTIPGYLYEIEDIKWAVGKALRDADYTTSLLERTESCQYTGFDDVKHYIEEEYRDEIKQYIENQKKLEADLKLKIELVESENQVLYRAKIKDIEGEYLDTIKDLRKRVEERDVEIIELRNKITELSKTQAEKIAEAEQKAREAIEALEALQCDSKKSIFKRLFK